MNAGNSSARGHGKSQPGVQSDTEAGRSKNRRAVSKRLD